MVRRRRSAADPNWLLIVGFFAAGVFTGGIGYYLYTSATPNINIKLHAGGYRYINPTLVTEPAGEYNTSSTVSKDLELKINGLIDSAKSSGALSDAAVYFRDLEPGKWLAVNANMQFSPGLLLKIPIMITYYKLAEQNPGMLNSQIVFNGPSYPNPELFSTTTPLTPGQPYTVDDLIGRMVLGSDETSAALLFNNIDKGSLQEIFSDLGIDFTEDTTNPDYISLKRYSFFFRVLYNATYLTPEYSEKALALLAQDNQRSLLETHLPQSIPIALRLGGRTFPANGAKKYEAYECDLVYYPAHNYLLCAAGRGGELGGIKTLFNQIGSAIYQYMAYQYNEP